MNAQEITSLVRDIGILPVLLAFVIFRVQKSVDENTKATVQILEILRGKQ